MKHYTQTIPLDLAEKLKAAGMPIETQPLYAQEAPNARGIVKAGLGLRCPSYAEVFDWFAEQGYYISIHSAETPLGVGFYPSFNHKNFRSVNTLTWHDAATKAIEKALKLIKKD